jgi:uncharacterized membrane protein
VAIAAMQAINASVRNAVFFPAFFLTPAVLGLTAAAARWFGAAAAIYLVFGLMLTFTVNVPMNDALAATAVPGDIAAARDIWRDYSQRWQVWNQARALASGIVLAFAALGVSRL